MNCTINMTGLSGDAKVAFEKKQVRIRYADTSPADRRMVNTILKDGKKLGLKLHKANDKGKPTEELKKHKVKGEAHLVLVGKPEAVKKLAIGLVEAELSSGRMALASQDDGSWKSLKKGEFDPEKTKKITTHTPVVGG